MAMEAAPLMADAAGEMTEEAVMAAPRVSEPVNHLVQQPDIALWFFLGSMATIIIYLLIAIVKELIKERKN